MAKQTKATCGAKTKQGHPCKLPAGFGTDHVGTGRCKFHGGASKGAPKGNSNGVKHGFYRKHLPEESFLIIEEIEKQDPIDILWGSITIQWAAIIRAQKLMYVKDQEDKTTSLTRYSEGDGGYTKQWEHQQAWDKQEQFLNAQSRAINTLGGQIERYDKLCRSSLATEEQKQRISKLKAEVENLTGVNDEYEDMSEILEEVYGSEE